MKIRVHSPFVLLLCAGVLWLSTGSVDSLAADHSGAAAGVPPARVLEDAPPFFRNQFVPRHPAPNHVTRAPGITAPEDWAPVIDATWGPGLSYTDHLYIWASFWNSVDTRFACFPGLSATIWDDVWDLYYPEVLDTVSRGRLASIIWWSCVALEESHQITYDSLVAFTQLDPGVPLFVVGAWGENGHFGAGLTCLPDSTLLVYKAVDPHPLGLVPGDRVLGYDGRPWTEIYPELMAAELPITGWWWGTTPVSFTESFMVSAGMNWHLFDTIDVIKYATDDTVHLPTSLLVGESMHLWATEQMDVPGVPMPDFLSGEMVNWGMITGTKIGYIYSMGWFPRADSTLIIDTWITALDSLQNELGATGVIIDFRTCYGAQFSFGRGLDYLFDSAWQVAEFDTRCLAGDHFDLCQVTSTFWRDFVAIPGKISAGWDLPIAILTGPGELSGGDLYPMMLSMHPRAKVFGKPTAGAFTGVSEFSLHPNWVHQVTHVTEWLSDHPGDYLVRKEFPSADFPWVDYEPVWLTPDGVAAGTDDVVEAAKAWIISFDRDQDGVVNEIDICPDDYNPGQEDDDLDGYGDVCETCPGVCNPDQGITIEMNGDANANGSITSADIIYLVGYVFKGGAAPLPLDAAGDVNCTGDVTSADIIYLVGYVFKGGPEPCDVCQTIGLGWTCP